MPILLLVEDNSADLRRAADIARRAGFAELEVSRISVEARGYLDKAMSGKVPLPDAMIVDLDRGMESGFELLRFWQSRPQLKSIPVIIWTLMGAREREICKTFGVYRFVSKDDDPHVLLEALASTIQNSDSESRADEASGSVAFSPED